MTDYEALADRARDARSTLDEYRYVIGDIAMLVEKDYGRNLIGQFANDIGLAPVTLRQYRSVSAFYENNIRALFSPLITWSHANLARRYAAKVADTPGAQLEAAMALLEAAADNDWTVGKLEVEVKTMLGAKVTPQRIVELHGTLAIGNTSISVTFDDYDTRLIAGYNGKRVRCVLYEDD